MQLKAFQAQGAVQHPRRVTRANALRVSAVAAPPAPKYQRPDASGRYGKYGGKYVPETLIPALAQLEIDYKEAVADPSFKVMVYSMI